MAVLRFDAIHRLRYDARRLQSINVIGAQVLPVGAGLALRLEAHNQHRDRDTEHANRADCKHAKSLVIRQIHSSRYATDKQSDTSSVDQQAFNYCHSHPLSQVYRGVFWRATARTARLRYGTVRVI